MARNYKKEYKNYQGKPEQIKRRAMRNAAHRLYERQNGNVSSDTDIDHIKPIVKGGRNAPSNLRARSRSRNRSFKRTRTARMK